MSPFSSDWKTSEYEFANGEEFQVPWGRKGVFTNYVDKSWPIGDHLPIPDDKIEGIPLCNSSIYLHHQFLVQLVIDS